MSNKIFEELAKHSLLYTIGTLASLAGSVLLLPVYTRFLSKNDYGILEMADILYSLLTIVFITSFSQAVAKLYNGAQTDDEKHKVFGTIYWSCLFVGIFCGIILLLFFKNMISVSLLGSNAYTFHIGISIGIFMVSPAYLMAIYFFNLNKKPSLYVLVGLLKLILNVGFNLFYIIKLKMGAAGMLLGEFTSTLILLILLFFYLVRTTKLRFDVPVLFKAIKFGFPFVPALLFTMLLLKADRFLMQKYCSLDDVGIFSMGSRFPSLMNFVLLGSFSQIWIATGLYDVAKMENAKDVQARLATYFFMIMLVSFMALGFFSSTILRIFATPEFYAADLPMQIISCSMVIYSLNLFFQTGAIVKGKTWLLPVASFISLLVCVGGNALLLPKLGYIASAWVTFFTYFTYVAVLYFLCNKYYEIKYDFPRIGLLYLISIALLMVNNLIEFGNFYLDLIKQTGLFVLIPAYMIFGKFLKENETKELGDLLGKINPVLLKVFEKVTGMNRRDTVLKG